MILYCDDEKEIYIGVCGVETDEPKIIRKVSKILGIEFETSNVVPDELEPHLILDFEMDTIVVQYKDYNEDFAELSEKGIAIYIIP